MDAIQVYTILGLLGIGVFCWLVIWNDKEMKREIQQKQFCRNCGQAATGVKFCTKCGKKII